MPDAPKLAHGSDGQETGDWMEANRCWPPRFRLQAAASASPSGGEPNLVPFEPTGAEWTVAAMRPKKLTLRPRPGPGAASQGLPAAPYVLPGASVTTAKSIPPLGVAVITGPDATPVGALAPGCQIPPPPRPRTTEEAQRRPNPCLFAKQGEPFSRRSVRPWAAACTRASSCAIPSR